jgi:hypothetical protein
MQGASPEPEILDIKEDKKRVSSGKIHVKFS